MTNERKARLARAVPYTGPLYNAHGREIAPAQSEAMAARPVRPCM